MNYFDKVLYKAKSLLATANEKARWERAFLKACQSGNLKCIKKLCKSEFRGIADIHSGEESGFKWACKKGHLDVVKFLTTAPELIKAGHTFVNIHASNEWGFLWACANGDLEVVKFLTTSKELLEAGHTLVDIDVNDEELFRSACQNKHWNVVEYLIFDLKIKKTQAIEGVMELYPEVEGYFKAREEHEQWGRMIREKDLENRAKNEEYKEASKASTLRV